MTTATVLDGSRAAATIKQELASRVLRLREHGPVPGLGTILVGDDPGSRLYVNGKHRDCEEVGLLSLRIDLPETAAQRQVEDAVDQLNADPGCSGFIVQLPLPAHLDMHAVLERILPDKDADGLHPMSLGRLVLGAAVLSVGLTRTVEGALGDVHPDVGSVASHVAHPVGGVGPMTRAMLLTNVVEAEERAAKIG